jgi:radical S-adenosyl methionine domain-containing protein 2
MNFKNQNVPFSVCWTITTQCNQNCDFCYAVKNIEELNLSANFKILNKLVDSGVKKISFVGGEPLLYSDLFSLIKKAHNYHIITSLTTNAILMDNSLLDKYSDYLDWITFSLDSVNNDIQEKMTREGNHVDKVINLLNRINEKGYNIDIKINTIASKINNIYIEEMIPLIAKYDLIKRWKIHQFTPLRNNAKNNKEKFYITPDEFNNLKNEILNNKMLKDLNVRVNFSGEEELEKSYFVIDPNGDVNGNNGINKIGNALTNSICELWKKIEGKEDHFKRYKKVMDI